MRVGNVQPGSFPRRYPFLFLSLFLELCAVVNYRSFGTVRSSPMPQPTGTNFSRVLTYPVAMNFNDSVGETIELPVRTVWGPPSLPSLLEPTNEAYSVPEDPPEQDTARSGAKYGRSILEDPMELLGGSGVTLVIVRSGPEEYWKQVSVFPETADNIFHVGVVGPLDIGMKEQVTVLLRMLFLQGRTVVYHNRTNDYSGWVYEFEVFPSKDGPDPYDFNVDVISEKDFVSRQFSSLMDSTRTYYVIECNGSVDFPRCRECYPNHEVNAKVIIVASP
jgi:hypothetical protein